MKPLGLLLILAVPFAHAQDGKTPCRILYVPSEQVVVDKMLDMAKVKKDDIVFDLGCGDGRIVVSAAKKYEPRQGRRRRYRSRPHPGFAENDASGQGRQRSR